MGLKNKTIFATIWAGIGTLGSAIVGVIVTMVLARFLTPNDFGIIEIVLAIITVSEVFVDGGFSQAVIREKDITKKELSSIFTINLLIALLVYAVVFFFSPLLVSYFSLPDNATVILRVLGLKIIVDAFAFIQQANCARQMQFKTISSIILLAIIIAAVCSFISIYLGLGIWALAIYYLSLSILKCVLINIKMKWMPSLSFDFKSIKRFILFGSNLVGINVIDKIMTNVESLSIGKAFTKSDLGIFSQGRKFNSLVIETLLSIVQRVTYPALSQINNEELQAKGYQQIIQLISFAIVPLTIFIGVFSSQFMVVFFGNQWEDAGVFVTIFSFFMMIYPAYSVCHNAFLVRNKTRLLLKIATCKQILRLLVIFLSICYSILFFAVAITGVQIIMAFIYIYYGCKLFRYSVLSLLNDLSSVYLLSFICVGLVYFLSSISHLNGTVAFCIWAFVYFILYVGVSFLLQTKPMMLSMDIFKELRK